MAPAPVLVSTELVVSVSAVKVLIVQDMCYHCGGGVAVCPPGFEGKVCDVLFRAFPCSLIDATLH